jgi:hypothetical protein
VPDVKSIYTTIGGGSRRRPVRAPGAAEVRKATLTCSSRARPAPAQAGAGEPHARRAGTLPGVRSKVGLGGSGEKYILVLTGDDPRCRRRAGGRKDLRTIPGLGSVASSASLVRPEIAVRPDLRAPPTWA